MIIAELETAKTASIITIEPESPVATFPEASLPVLWVVVVVVELVAPLTLFVGVVELVGVLEPPGAVVGLVGSVGVFVGASLGSVGSLGLVGSVGGTSVGSVGDVGSVGVLGSVGGVGELPLSLNGTIE